MCPMRKEFSCVLSLHNDVGEKYLDVFEYFVPVHH